MMCDSNANFECCKLCFHTCGVNRLVGVKGRCALDGGLYVSSVCLHKGEEPALGGEKGVCNVFFSACFARTGRLVLESLIYGRQPLH